MPDFAIRSAGDPRFVIWVANCTREHADSVYASVNTRDFPGPHDLTLEQVEHLYDTPPSRRWWQVWKRG